MRLLASAQIAPAPRAPDVDTAIRDRDSIGGFNLVYHVATPADRFGTWTQIRFERNSLARGGIEYPQWKAVTLDALPRELQVYRSMHVHQREDRPLDGAWFALLLAHLV